MKYIIMSVNKPGSFNIELPFIFPDVCVHALIAEAMTQSLAVHYPQAIIKPISAGFVSSVDLQVDCEGRSESLDLKSRGVIDDMLISKMDYGSMHVC